MKQMPFKRQVIQLINNLFLWAILTCMVACSHKEKLERTWERAGKNRVELEKVLRHYENDKRKYQAALFLIERMADCYSWSGEDIDSLKYLKFLSVQPNMEVWTDSVKQVWNHALSVQRTKIYDAQVITADFLIRHIDHSFAIWDSRPWSKYYTFDEFCQHILPYRLGDEPLELWREPYYKHFARRVDSIYSGGNVIRKIQAIEIIFKKDSFRWNDLFPSLPHLGAEYLLHHRLGSCRESCDLTLYLLRALGIPAVTDHYIASPQTSGRHWWTAVRDTTGILVPFWLIESKVGNDIKDERPKGKVFRSEFGGQTHDVTSEYFGKNIAQIEVNPNFGTKNLYLCIFSCGDLVPIAKGLVKKGKATFHDLEPGIRFFPMFQNQSGSLCFAGYPFCVDSLGKTIIYTPNKKCHFHALLRRKYAYHHYLKERGLRMSGNIVIGSNRMDFHSPDTLFTFPHTLKTNRHIIKATSNKLIRFVCWQAIPSQRNVSAAEIAFYEYNTGKKLPFRILNPPTSTYGHEVSKMTDGDVLTTYQAKENGPQTIIFDLGNSHLLSHMLYVPQNDGNYIEPGDTYELFYQDGINGWKSLGKQTATTDSLIYNDVPGHAVFWLRDLTKGHEEQQFILDKRGEQSFH